MEFDPSWSDEGVLLTRPSADPILEEPSIPADFGAAVYGGGDVDATITMTRSGCELRGDPRRIHPGRVTLELVNGSDLDGYFTLWNLPGSLHDLWAAHRWDFRFGRPGVASLHPWSAEAWASDVPLGMGRWGVLCHVDEIESPNGIQIRPVGVAGPLNVGVG